MISELFLFEIMELLRAGFHMEMLNCVIDGIQISTQQHVSRFLACMSNSGIKWLFVKVLIIIYRTIFYAVYHYRCLLVDLFGG